MQYNICIYIYVYASANIHPDACTCTGTVVVPILRGGFVCLDVLWLYKQVARNVRGQNFDGAVETLETFLMELGNNVTDRNFWCFVLLQRRLGDVLVMTASTLTDADKHNIFERAGECFSRAAKTVRLPRHCCCPSFNTTTLSINVLFFLPVGCSVILPGYCTSFFVLLAL